MMKKAELMVTTPASTWAVIAERIAEAPTNDFSELIRISGLDPSRHLRFADLSGVDFTGSDLRGFDFTGARLIGCDFSGAKIEGARFDQAEIGAARSYARLDPKRTNLRNAQDWDAFVKAWRGAVDLPPDDHLPVGAVFQDAPFAPEMVLVPAGKFMMGTNPEHMAGLAETHRFTYHEWVKKEGPQHAVCMAQPFAVSRFAVTFDEWDTFVTNSDSMHTHDDEGWGRGRSPVINVSWGNASAYAQWLRAATGKPYRLLSEAEWEYCCRAGTTTDYSTGERITREQAQFNASSTVEVGTFPANAWGLHEMHGNVWEWCQDEWHDSYNGPAPGDGAAWQSHANGGTRIVRGGSFNTNPQYLRSAFRYSMVSGFRQSELGFRVARALTS